MLLETVGDRIAVWTEVLPGRTSPNTTVSLESRQFLQMNYKKVVKRICNWSNCCFCICNAFFWPPAV